MAPSFLSRRSFHAALAGGLGVGASTWLCAQETASPAPVTPPADAEPERDYPAPSFKPKFKRPQLKALLIQDFVIYAHSDLKMVELLLQKDVNLVNATVDWGGGDWESGLGAASHMGRREIAEFLLSKGARIDIFAATMLGYLDVVKSLLTLQPQLINARGPHGFTLLSHAKAGKEQSADVLAFLQDFKAPATDMPSTGGMNS
ncbi:MAG TPA: hypothetical protein VNQ76_08640 [Planctomicrobium sp.]|nr:hypothetical protein [Planctomicrobium sp.]